MLEPDRDMQAPTGTRNGGLSIDAVWRLVRRVVSAVREQVGGWRPQPGLWPTGLILVAALAATIGAWRLVERDHRHDGVRDFNRLANNVAAELREAMHHYKQLLRGGVALFHSKDWVSRDTWRTFVRHLEVEERHPGIQGLGFVAALQPTEIAAHVARMRAEGAPDYAIRPQGERPFYAPIAYLEPQDLRNRGALGYDLFSEPVARAAMEAARDTGGPKLSGKATLVEETPWSAPWDIQAGVLLFLPLYRIGAEIETIEERRAALLGWIYAPFRMGDFVRGAFGRSMAYDVRAVRVELFDGATMSESARLYDSADLTQLSVVHPSQFSFTVAIDLFGRTWTLRASSLPAFEAREGPYIAFAVLLTGTLVSLLMAAVAWTVNRRQMEASQHAARLATELAERRRVETALRESESRLRHMANTSPSIMWSAGPDGKNTWASDRWYRYTGQTDCPEWAEFVHPDDRERCLAAWAAAIRDGSIYENEGRLRRHDGQYRWFIARAEPERDASDRVVAWFGATTEIDDLKRAEQAVRESESLFRAVFNQQFQFMAILSPDGLVRSCNDTFFAAMGLRGAEVLNRHFWDTPWWSGLPKEQSWLQAAIQRAASSDERVMGEIAIAVAGGSVRQAEFAVTGVHDEAGRVINVIAEGRDITERKRAEEHQKLLTHELAHRVKNSMAVIQSIARQTLRGAPKQFAEAFSGRLQSLAAAHDLLLEKGWLVANLKDLASRQLAVAHGRVRLAGPDVTLSPILATSLALVLHELVTNAAKYGALSAPRGQVELNWQVVGDHVQRRVHMTWKERGGPPVAAPDHEGFGSTLIQRSLPGATVERRFEPEGLVCTIDLPLS